jgi:hypothetical protein
MTGGEQLNANLTTVAKRTREACIRAMLEEGSVQMAKMVSRTPLDEGTLILSYRIVVEEDGELVHCRITCGVPGAEAYAWIQHERLDFKHPKGGQAKYMESVLWEGRAQIPKNIGSRIAASGALGA